MMRQPFQLKDYVQRLNRVTAYIFDHLDQPLDLLKLAEVACMSPYHWHRLYHALYGETIADTVKRLRLQRAAAYLAHTDLSIDKVGAKSGYENLQSFTRLFKEAYGMPPGRYRKEGGHQLFLPSSNPADPLIDYPVTIQETPALTVAAIEHHGSYMHVGKAFHQLYNWLKAHHRMDKDQRSIGIYFGDPFITPEEQLYSQAGVTVPENFHISTPLVKTVIQGGYHAILRYTGPYASMHAAYQWLYGQWLPRSGYEAANAPVFEEYVNDPRQVPATELITDIYLPLQTNS